MSTKSEQLEILYRGAQAVANDARKPDEADPVTLAKRMLFTAQLVLAEAKEQSEQ